MVSEVKTRQGVQISNIRSLNIAEPGPFDLDLTIALPRSVPDLTTNMFPLAIAIRPDDKEGRPFCLVLDILCNMFIVLESVRSREILPPRKLTDD